MPILDYERAWAVPNSNERRRVVIVGGGFGGLEAAKRLRKTNVDVTLIDRNNYHLFQPLLYQVATGGLSPANIATPLRYILSRQRNCEVLMAEVCDIDIVNQLVILADGQLKYDDLILATGATHSYFGRNEWEQNAPGLKSIADAINIRRRIFIAFEAAERETDSENRRALMTFVIVGGGPTGVELAGALSEIARHTLKHDFRHINPEDARIILVEAAENILGRYPKELCRRATEKVRQLGIEVLTQTKVTEIHQDHVRLSAPAGEATISTHTVLWAAGVAANPLGKILAEKCGITTDRVGRVPVSPQLTVGANKNLFVIGDLAACQDASGQLLPGLAPVAMQQGEYVAHLITQRLRQSQREQASAEMTNHGEAPFRYRDHGTMATIGRAIAVVQIGKRQFCGFFAWILWLLIHLLEIIQVQNRMLVLMQWMWNYFTFNRSSRIITGEDPVIHLSDSLMDKTTRNPG